MISTSQKDFGTLLIICINQTLAYMAFLCFVPMSWIKWILLDNIIPVSILNIIYNLILQMVLLEISCFA